MNNIRQILNDWFANGFGEPPIEHQHLFRNSMYREGWTPKEEIIDAFRANPERERTFTVDGIELHSCNGYSTTMIELPNGVWIDCEPDHIWYEYDGGYVVCFANDTIPVSHIFKV